MGRVKDSKLNPEAPTQQVSVEPSSKAQSGEALARERAWRWRCFGAVVGAATLLWVCLDGTGGGEAAIVCILAPYIGGILGFSIGTIAAWAVGLLEKRRM